MIRSKKYDTREVKWVRILKNDTSAHEWNGYVDDKKQINANTVYIHTHTHHDKLTRDEPFKHDQVLSQQKAEFTDKPSFQKKKKKKDYYETEWHPWGKAFKFLAL